MAQCDTKALLSSAKCFSCYVSPGMVLPVKLALLCQILNGSNAPCDPMVLLARAQCFSCLSKGIRRLLKLQLLCNILGGTAVCVKPPAPTSFSYVGGGGTYSLTWVAATNPVLDFLVSWGTTPGGPYTTGSQIFSASARGGVLNLPPTTEFFAVIIA